MLSIVSNNACFGFIKLCETSENTELINVQMSA